MTITAPQNNSIVAAGSDVACSATASDSDHWTQGGNSDNEADGIASYTWSAPAGTFPNGNSGSSVTWRAPNSNVDVTITCTANDVGEVYPPDTGTRDDQPRSSSVTVKVQGKAWDVGTPISVTISQPLYRQKFAPGVEVTCAGSATDTDHWTLGPGEGTANDSIASYTWLASGGRWKDDIHTGQNVTWIAADTVGLYAITLTADDVDGVSPPDTGTRNDAPGSAEVVVAVCTHAHPTNFRQTIGIKGIGVLFFRYMWDSTSGNRADLAGVEMGEYVSYPGWPEPSFMFPNPLFMSGARTTRIR